MRKTEIKNNKGITLIALIVTIIILLILATVSIKLLVDNGIVGRSKSATSKYVIAEEKEKINLAYTDYKMEKAENGDATLIVEGATVSGEEYSGWTITFDKTGNRYKFIPSQGQPELKPKTEDERLLERHLLGETGETRTLDVVFDGTNKVFLDIENGVIPNASTEITFLSTDLTGTEDNDLEIDVILEYKGKVYALQTNAFKSSEIIGLELLYEPEGREGQKVKYSYDGIEENEQEWTILYDYGDSVEIIGPEPIGKLDLGYTDKTAIGNNELEKAIYSYNNAIKRLNEYCSSLVTNPDKISVRSVGSNPQNPNSENTKMYTSEKLSKYCEGKYNGIAKSSSAENYEQDYIRMSYCKVLYGGGFYWIPLRGVNETDYSISFNIWYGTGSDLPRTNRILWSVRETTASHSSGLLFYPLAVRPIVKISADSIKY